MGNPTIWFQHQICYEFGLKLVRHGRLLTIHILSPFQHCFSLPENSSWMTPFSSSMSPNLSWRKSVTTPFSNKNSNRANSWSRLVNVLRVWESSDGLNKSSVSANEARYHQGQSLEWHKQIHSFFSSQVYHFEVKLTFCSSSNMLRPSRILKCTRMYYRLYRLTIHMECSKSESCYWHSKFLFLWDSNYIYYTDLCNE